MIKKTDFISHIREGKFRDLFITELGWNRYRGQEKLPAFVVDDIEYNISAIAERSGFQILLCEVDEIPTQSIAKKIDTKLRRQAADYICIYRLNGSNAHDLWVVPVRTNEKRDLVLVEYEDAKAELLYSKIEGLTFALDEVSNIVDLRTKVQGAFAVNSEKITKDFYAGFKKEHKAFAEFISGIDDYIDEENKGKKEKDRIENRKKQWYTSVMLNRLMFCYFIQKKGFLNLDHDYLRNKLNWVRQEKGEGRFFKSFYQGFLTSLFHDGLNSPRHDKNFEQRYGKIPYLNGGMFDDHEIERDYDNIDIADEAFIRLFDFFDKWRWHLDTRLTASGKDINPDVLGYIFEQYINDRAQMGAYYTKEDITEYIGRNCILPFLFDEVKRTANDESAYFTPDGFVWSTLRNSGDRYVFDAVKKGYAELKDIPENIRQGIITPEMRHEYSEISVNELPDGHTPLAELRSDWNTRTPEPWGLPAEIWRETIERLQRCDEVIEKIKAGEISSVNDLITYNLDIRTFALDLLIEADSRFVGRFYHALQKVTILDPTCGSGAFLFAAMNILEPLYEVCIERMQDFNSRNGQMFKAELAEIAHKYRSNIQYFIFKSIILRNLYGVDIMAEAVEIAKLRLFLKMVAVVDVDRRASNLGLDPLPDIDFNIRCGNTLVGYANKVELDRDLSSATDILQMLANEEFKTEIEEEMRKVSMVYSTFKDIQLRQDEDMVSFKKAKKDLRERLENLNDTLNRRLFTATQSDNRAKDETHTDIFTSTQYADWLKSHQPFHWLAEFYQIIAPESDGGNGGFDVIIGNPPYVVYNSKTFEYKIHGDYKTIECCNLYAFCVERSQELKSSLGRFGMIVPNSSISAQKMLPLQQIISKNNNCWISNYSWRPSKLFEGADMLLAIIMLYRNEMTNIFATQYRKWYNEYRNVLFKTTIYNEVTDITILGSVPKLPSNIGRSIMAREKCQSNNKVLSSIFGLPSQHKLYYFRAVQYWFKILVEEPIYDEDGEHKVTGEMKPIYCVSEPERNVLVSLLSSSTYFLHYIIWSSCQVVNSRDFNLYFNMSSLTDKVFSRLDILGKELQNDYQMNSHVKERSYSKKGRNFTMRKQHFFIKYSKHILDSIDLELAKHYGFTEEELDFIINYDIKYRMGDELNAEES